MDVAVNLASPIPPYEQVRAQIAAIIASGRLAEGSRLPTIRALAADLGIATGTVGRAYRELETAGLVASRRRSGTVVIGQSAPTAASAAVRQAAAELAACARRAGMDEETTISLLRAALVAVRS